MIFLRIVAILLVFCGVFGQLMAQRLTLSPYSRYGIGDLIPSTTTRNASMGGLGIATENFFSVNRLNPASYTDLVFTTLDVSGFGQFSNLRVENDEETQFTAGFQNVSLAFPSNKGPTFVMGFAPYSAVGYNVREEKPVTIDDSLYFQRVQFGGSGGLNQFYLGFGAAFFKRHLRIGANLSYAFGTIRNEWATQIFNSVNGEIGPPTSVEEFRVVSIEREAFLNGLTGELGIIYADTIRKGDNPLMIRVGLVADTRLVLRGERTEFYDNLLISDTLGINLDGEVDLPPKFAFGLLFSNPGVYSIGFDAVYQDWSSFSYFDDPNTLGNQLRFAVGGEWTPNMNSPKYAKRISLRAGAFFNQTYIQFGGSHVNDYGFSFGIGLPAGQRGNSRLNPGRATSQINLGFVFGTRGSLAAGQPLVERYVRIRVGITLNDRWFVQRVVD